MILPTGTLLPNLQRNCQRAPERIFRWCLLKAVWWREHPSRQCWMQLTLLLWWGQHWSSLWIWFCHCKIKQHSQNSHGKNVQDPGHGHGRADSPSPANWGWGQRSHGDLLKSWNLHKSSLDPEDWYVALDFLDTYFHVAVPPEPPYIPQVCDGRPLLSVYSPPF